MADESMENPRKNSKFGVGNNGNLVPGNPGNSGGKKGRSGRRPERYREMIFRELDRPAVLRAIRTILQDPDHRHFPQVLKLVMDQALGKPKAHDSSAQHLAVCGVVALPPIRSPVQLVPLSPGRMSGQGPAEPWETEQDASG